MNRDLKENYYSIANCKVQSKITTSTRRTSRNSQVKLAVRNIECSTVQNRLDILLLNIFVNLLFFKANYYYVCKTVSVRKRKYMLLIMFAVGWRRFCTVSFIILIPCAVAGMGGYDRDCLYVAASN